MEKNVDGGQILKQLQKKVSDSGLNRKISKEYYAVFAKSFKKGRRFKEDNVFFFDLKDIEKGFRG